MKSLTNFLFRVFCLIIMLIASIYGCIFFKNTILTMINLRAKPNTEIIGSILGITLTNWSLFAGFILVTLLCFVIAVALLLLYRKDRKNRIKYGACPPLENKGSSIRRAERTGSGIDFD